MANEKRQSDPARVSIDLGFGGLFKSLSELLDVVSDLTESEGAEVNQSGEFQVKGLGDKARGVYGFSIRSVAGGAPRVERFGNIRKTEQGPVVADVREPLVDIFDEESEILVVAELPGVQESQISVAINGDILEIESSGERRYAKELLLPQAVDAASLRQIYTNGILELRLKKA